MTPAIVYVCLLALAFVLVITSALNQRMVPWRPVAPTRGRHVRRSTARRPETYVGTSPPPSARPGDTYVSMATGVRYRRTRLGNWRPEARRGR